ncbi:MAG TPA: FHA domain-containing serine/threonine-protein kinase [Nannocystaceae bacterium]|nr:FHA domain-containing serine/threonine-protein kinase [Nannocystaceae bacterium]
MPALSPGSTYREFEILEELGAGSFATVYKVLAPGFDRPLALKVANRPHLGEDTIKRAIREVAVLRSLTNPNVARLHGSSIGSDHFYVLMDFVQGQQLDHAHDFDEPMAVADALRIAMQACMGLAEAHAQGVVHRDVKPANIWIQPDGTVKLLDFGLARAWGVPWAYGTNATAARTVVGTPHYCQPEQLLTDQLTPASDVYSLATILYELLCGHAVLFPHRRVSAVVEGLRDNPIAWLDAHAMRSMVPIERYPGCGGLPDALLELLRTALAKEPRHRPQTAGEMASVLGRILVEDLGALEPASVRIVVPGVGPSDVELMPGRRTLGSAPECDVQLDGAPPQAAIIDWSGSPRPVQIRAAPGVELAKNGEPVRRATNVEPGDVFAVGEAHFVVIYPED